MILLACPFLFHSSQTEYFLKVKVKDKWWGHKASVKVIREEI
jgi:hypothetical protein